MEKLLTNISQYADLELLDECVFSRIVTGCFVGVLYFVFLYFVKCPVFLYLVSCIKCHGVSLLIKFFKLLLVYSLNF